MEVQNWEGLVLLAVVLMGGLVGLTLAFPARGSLFRNARRVVLALWGIPFAAAGVAVVFMGAWPSNSADPTPVFLGAAGVFGPPLLIAVVATLRSRRPQWAAGLAWVVAGAALVLLASLGGETARDAAACDDDDCMGVSLTLTVALLLCPAGYASAVVPTLAGHGRGRISKGDPGGPEAAGSV